VEGAVRRWRRRWRRAAGSEARFRRDGGQRVGEGGGRKEVKRSGGSLFRPTESESSFWFKPLVLFFIYFFGFKLATGTPAFVSRLY
jgi:hypothetical protein